jgi:hypothetical protein
MQCFVQKFHIIRVASSFWVSAFNVYEYYICSGIRMARRFGMGLGSGNSSGCFTGTGAWEISSHSKWSFSIGFWNEKSKYIQRNARALTKCSIHFI